MIFGSAGKLDQLETAGAVPVELLDNVADLRFGSSCGVA